MTNPALRIAGLAVCLLILAARPAAAVTVTVPDDWPTIQQAIDSGADEVLVRPGAYPETLVITRAMALKGIVSDTAPLDSLPRVAGLVLDDFGYTSYITTYLRVWNLRFESTVRNDFDTALFWNPLEIDFTRCGLEFGLSDESSTAGQIEYYIRSCWIEGPLRLNYPQKAEFLWNIVRAPIALETIEYASFRDNRFTGRAAGIASVGVGELDLERNQFEGCELPVRDTGSSGMWVSANKFVGPGRVAVECSNTSALETLSGNFIVGFDRGVVGYNTELYSHDNHIEDCGVGMEFQGYIWSGSSTRDTILACGTGARLTFVGRFEMAGALVLGCRDHGLDLKMGIGLVASSVIGRCGGDGIRVAVDYAPDWSFAPIMLINNTSYANRGSGYVMSVAGTAIPAEARGNIGLGNGRHGIEVAAGDSVISACNDWFGNANGDRNGLFASTTDLAVDPLFCDIAQNNVQLSARSPLLNVAGCGAIGALGQGCEAPIVCRIVTFTVASKIGGIEVRWQVADAAPGFVAWIERADSPDGPWLKVESQRAHDGDVTVEYDRTAAPALSYWYRLVATDRGLTRALGGPVRVETLPPTRFALLGTGPNPSPGTVEATFQLAHAAEITLELFDAQGRRIATLAHGSWPAGIHCASWAGARSASGVYLVRYRHPNGEDVRRIAIVR